MRVSVGEQMFACLRDLSPTRRPARSEASNLATRRRSSGNSSARRNRKQGRRELPARRNTWPFRHRLSALSPQRCCL